MSILTLTVNPALDLSTDIDIIKSSTKLRCGPAVYDPGGGGVNVSRAIKKLGGESKAFVAIGGVTGQMLKSLLEGEGVETTWFEIDGLTRESFVVNERSSGKQFRFVLPGPDWSEQQTNDMLSALRQAIEAGGNTVKYVVASGSLPPGVPDGLYNMVAELAEQAGAHLVFDSSGRAMDMAKQEGQHPPHLWIMDQDEATHLAGSPIPDIEALEKLAIEFKNRNLAKILILSFSEGGAIAVSDDERLRILPPKVDVISKVGAGDSFVAGLVMKLAGGASLYEGCAFAVAAAASAVTTPATELCNGEQTRQYFNMILNGQQ